MAQVCTVDQVSVKTGTQHYMTLVCTLDQASEVSRQVYNMALVCTGDQASVKVDRYTALHGTGLRCLPRFDRYTT